MKCYEPDPDVVRWGLHLIDVCSINDGGSPVTITQYDRDLSQTELIREGYNGTSYLPQTELLREGYTGTSYLPQTELNKEDCYVPSHANVENDEIIAHTLQEELSRIAIAESSGSSYVEEEHQKESVLSQDWLGSSKRHCNFGYERNCEMSVGPSGQDLLPQIEDESTLDGEVGKRLNQSQMVAVPHVPKINGEIPSVDEATSDHQRLMDRLELYDLVESKVSGDGNCQFRSLSDQIYRTTDYHKFVREQVVIQLKSHPELYKSYVPMAYDEYLRKMSKTGEWGDHVTLQAAADAFGFKIFIITSFKDTCYIEILPHMQRSKRTIFLSFWAEVHYNSIYPIGDLPTGEHDKKKKKWWWLGSSRWATSPNEV
ncbi:OVARIAN TUMOR DOMAIN-containing deubiquitinating enzyme 12 isoform X2 [Ipomoea triloba]|uniref:OVARIAN TUMOR DOMAIN-containing deubiquitinating enzyme 12 isoform X2 n=1 Tax=Ipomoea triloba TaxID=35885 RepID=UPI00125D0D6E|nr:OVARIAN TUMOR DOMAIN-containing deubiquitinating enzyme 12 isoform X2 [Ipomoea triloba]